MFLADCWAFGFRKAAGFPHRHDAGHVFRARAQFLLLPAAGDEGVERGSFFDVQEPRALWAIDLVPGGGKQGHAGALHVDLHLAQRLHGVGVEQEAALLTNRADFMDRLNRADLVVAPHDGHDARIRPNRRRHVFGGNAPLAVRLHVGDLDPLRFQGLARREYGLVLDGRGDDVASPLGGGDDATERPVVAFRSAGGEEDLIAVRGADERRRMIAGVFDRDSGFTAVPVDAVRVSELLTEIRLHRGHNLGPHRGGCVVVHVDGFHGVSCFSCAGSCVWASSFSRAAMRWFRA